jgi:hypothetical protein
MAKSIERLEISAGREESMLLTCGFLRPVADLSYQHRQPAHVGGVRSNPALPPWPLCHQLLVTDLYRVRAREEEPPIAAIRNAPIK